MGSASAYCAYEQGAREKAVLVLLQPRLDLLGFLRLLPGAGDQHEEPGTRPPPSSGSGRRRCGPDGRIGEGPWGRGCEACVLGRCLTSQAALMERDLTLRKEVWSQDPVSQGRAQATRRGEAGPGRTRQDPLSNQTVGAPDPDYPRGDDEMKQRQEEWNVEGRCRGMQEARWAGWGNWVDGWAELIGKAPRAGWIVWVDRAG